MVRKSPLNDPDCVVRAPAGRRARKRCVRSCTLICRAAQCQRLRIDSAMPDQQRRRFIVGSALAAAGLMLPKVSSATSRNITIALVLKSISDPFTKTMIGAAQAFQKHYPYRVTKPSPFRQKTLRDAPFGQGGRVPRATEPHRGWSNSAHLESPARILETDRGGEEVPRTPAPFNTDSR